MNLLLALTVAIVVQDQTPFTAAPDPLAARQTTLWPGDWLEVRGQRRDYLRAYDHRHERPGYVHLAQVRTYTLTEPAAPELRALIAFLRDTPGSESLGIGYVALYLRVAPPAALDATVFDALGTMADRLARRASALRARKGERDSAAAQMEVATSYGVRFASFEDEGRTRVCYDGDAFRRVLAQRAQPEEKARAVLALTNPSCARPDLRPDEKRALHEWSLSVLDRADPTTVAPYLGNRLRLRRSSISAKLAYELHRTGKHAEATRLSEQGLNTFLRIDKAQLSYWDQSSYDTAALYVAASRWMREPPRPSRKGARLALELSPRAPGETCVKLVDRASKSKEPLATRCTYGVVWESSVRVSPQGRQLAVAVQHLPGWVETWVFQRAKEGFVVDALLPAAVDPSLGYVEVAGWTPDGSQMLVVREAFLGDHHWRRFQTLRATSLAIKTETSSLDRFVTFRRWHSPEWKASTLALR
jgi:hypothetical protein